MFDYNRIQLSSVVRVKATLPDVLVKMGHKTVTCRVIGRDLPYAIVITPMGSFEYSWEAVTRAVTGGTPLL